MGQQVIVENVTGAGGSIAVNKVTRAPPDGYTVGIGHIGTHVIVEAIQPVQFDVLKDLDPVGMICTNPQLLIAKMATPSKNLKEFMEYVKANEDKVTAGTGGVGTPAHLSAVYFQQKTGANFEIVHYRGAAPATQDVVAGHIDMNFDQAANSIPQYKAGKVKAFAVTAAEAPRRGARYPHRRRSGAAWVLHVGLARALGSARHARRRRLEAQRGDGRSACGSRRSQATRGPGPGHHAFRPTDRCCARRASQGGDREVVAPHQDRGNQIRVSAGAVGLRSLEIMACVPRKDSGHARARGPVRNPVPPQPRRR